MRRISSASEGPVSRGAGVCIDALGTATDTTAVAGGAALSTGAADDSAIDAVTVGAVTIGAVGADVVTGGFGSAKAKYTIAAAAPTTARASTTLPAPSAPLPLVPPPDGPPCRPSAASVAARARSEAR